MAAPAYDFDRFAPKSETEPDRAAVARKRNIRVVRGAGAPGLFSKMMRILMGSLFMMALMCGVLYTQANVTELQSKIAAAESTLDEEKAMYAYLTFELNNMSTQRSIEQRAEELGLVKMNSNQINYVRVEEGSQIEVKESPFAHLFDKAQTGLLSVMDYLSPQ